MELLGKIISDVGALLVDLSPVISIAVLSVFLEMRFPRRNGRPDGLRWLSGTVLTLSAWLLAILLLPVTAFVSAQVSQESGIGLLNAFDIPAPIAVLIGFLLYDLLGYAFHRVLHEVPLLWRLHRVHHSDDHVDAATALRVHPLEPFVGSFLAIAVVMAFGIPPGAIIAHFVFMQVFNFWHHANIRSFPGQRRLAVLFNIPELHEVHHSDAREHYNTNFGSVLSVWDRLFGTLKNDPDLDGKLSFGLDKNYWNHPSTIASLLIDPMRK